MTVADRQYVCPGETHAISHSVHLARMAAYYRKCRDCPFREETGQLPPQFPPRKQTATPTQHHTLFTAEGVRGRYLNELDRATVSTMTAAFASLLWERIDDNSDQDKRRPTVVVGYDQRPSSPDLIAGVTSALRRMGCGIVDIGPATLPLLALSVQAVAATGGLLVNGSGCDPSWTGLNFFDAKGQPIVGQSANDDGVGLTAIETRMQSPINRPTRSAGSHRTLRFWEQYERDLRERFHALRPLRVVVGVSTALLERIARTLFAALPCELTVLPLPVRARSVIDPADADIVRMSSAVTEAAADLGFLIDDCGQRCGVVDESGRLVGSDELTTLLDDAVQADATGRYWFRETFPTSDAFLTLAGTLSALSRSDATLSDVIAEAAVIS